MRLNPNYCQFVDPAQAVCCHRWNSPISSFTSGQDIRTTDNALLVLTYGNLHYAANSNWVNAGRSLVDKTYIDMLRHVQSLTNISTFDKEKVSAELDNFIRQFIRPFWDNMVIMDADAKSNLVCGLVDEASRRLFGSLHSEVAASRLLFFLCPMLPFFNYTLGSVQALRALGYMEMMDSYASFHQVMYKEYGNTRLLLANQSPAEPFYGSAMDLQLIQKMHQQTDWWQRRIFDVLLRHMAVQKNNKQQELFSCTPDGQLA